jgi:hypothetical protein
MFSRRNLLYQPQISNPSTFLLVNVLFHPATIYPQHAAVRTMNSTLMNSTSTNSTSRLCAPLAGPFLHIHNEDTSATFWISFSIISILLTVLTRRLVLGYVLRSPPTPTPAEVALAPCPRCQHTCITDAELPSPPKYQEILAADKKRLLVVPTIPRFIVCTILTLANITTIMLLAFDIQAFLYCGSELTEGTPITNRQQTTYAVTMWIVYACSVLLASSGILCWPIWARNLWGGEEAAERWPIRTDYGGMIFIGCLVPLCVVFFLVLIAVVLPVRMAGALWERIHGERVNVVEAGQVERGIGCESGSVTEVESFTEK